MQERNPPSRVRLEGVPAALFVESQDHQEDVLRELTLIDFGKRFDLGRSEPPRRVANLIGDIHHQYADVRASTRQQAVDALARGEHAVELVVPVRPGMAAALQEWLRLVEAADALCAEGALLTLPARPEVRELRRWYAHSIIACLDRPDPHEQEPVVAYGPPRVT